MITGGQYPIHTKYNCFSNLILPRYCGDILILSLSPTVSEKKKGWVSSEPKPLELINNLNSNSSKNILTATKSKMFHFSLSSDESPGRKESISSYKQFKHWFMSATIKSSFWLEEWPTAGKIMANIVQKRWNFCIKNTHNVFGVILTNFSAMGLWSTSVVISPWCPQCSNLEA